MISNDEIKVSNSRLAHIIAEVCNVPKQLYYGNTLRARLLKYSDDEDGITVYIHNNDVHDADRDLFFEHRLDLKECLKLIEDVRFCSQFGAYKDTLLYFEKDLRELMELKQ